jgi:hypothetical protein
MQQAAADSSSSPSPHPHQLHATAELRLSCKAAGLPSFLVMPLEQPKPQE